MINRVKIKLNNHDLDLSLAECLRLRSVLNDVRGKLHNDDTGFHWDYRRTENIEVEYYCKIEKRNLPWGSMKVEGDTIHIDLDNPPEKNTKTAPYAYSTRGANESGRYNQ